MFKGSSDICLHFIGIGGIGMSGIAHVLLSLGYKVSGSDLNNSPNVEKLRSLGANIFIGHHEDNVRDATIVIHTSAVNDSNPEVRKAKEQKIPIMRRAEMLAEIMRLKQGIAVAGTHGKTTTTSFLATIIKESQLDPTYIIGGVVANLKGHAHVGKGDYVIAEADESDGTFLLLNPIYSVITNIDYDHMEFYKTKENVHEAFKEFMNQVPFYGKVAVNYHDSVIKSLLGEIKKPWMTFGIDTGGTDKPHIYAQNIKYDHDSTSFDLFINNENQGDVTIHIPGEHNVLNALGAISIANQLGVEFSAIKKGLSLFKGVGRRFERLYERDSFELYDDYGHHPTEVKETLKTFKSTRPDKKKVAIFEPHRFSRTRDSWNEFVGSFDDVDELFIMDIYAASEEPIEGITSGKLIEEIKSKRGINVKYCSSENFDDLLNSLSQEDKSVMTLGAGSIGRKVRGWVAAQ